jgi:uncharacterized membrane protein (DUF485 family)
MTKTNAYSLLCVAIRVVVVYIAATSLIAMPSLILGYRMARDDGWVITLVIAVTFGVLIFGWVFAGKLAKLALARSTEQVFESDMEPRQWLGLAVSVIGAWFLFGVLKGGVYLIVRWVAISRQTIGWVALDDSFRQMIMDAYPLATQGILAVVFLFGGQGIANLIHRWRYGRMVQLVDDDSTDH